MEAKEKKIKKTRQRSTTKNNTVEKKISKTGEAMRKGKKIIEIVDLKAVLK